jgi:RimJ/RimL family protein N-acetyltransferase
MRQVEELHGTSPRQRHLVRQWKGLEPTTEPCEITVRDESGRILGRLLPLDATLARDRQTIEKLTRWRQQHMTSFLTQFTATYERTARWLERYLEDDTRLLFLLVEDAEPIAQLGLCGIQPQHAEGDGLLRGEPSRSSVIMFFAEAWLFQWAFLNLSLQSITARCLSHNRRVLSLVRLLGFQPTGTQKLRRELRGDDVHWVPIDETTEEVTDTTLTMIRLQAERDAFFKVHPWLAPAPKAIPLHDQAYGAVHVGN